jgi:alanine racemase
MARPLRARISLPALAHNLAVARRHAPRAKTMAVIKANGYGHGMLRVAEALKEAEGFAVLAVEEALALRQAGYRQKLLLLEGFFKADELSCLAENRIATVVHDEWQVRALERAKLARPVEIFLKFNSGMNRLGFRPGQVPEVLARLRACPAVGEVALMSHFATADDANGIAWQQDVVARLYREFQLPGSFANSAAILRYPEVHADWVRPGIMLYGSSPFADRSMEELGLRPVMTLESRLIAVQELQPGDRLGYGALFVADKPTRVGIVACGYADGYPRHAATGTPIQVNGQRTRTLGRVSMDMLFADITDIPAAGVGSPVVLWGEGVPVDEVAAAAGTISYELLCALAPRVPVSEG